MAELPPIDETSGFSTKSVLKIADGYAVHDEPVDDHVWFRHK